MAQAASKSTASNGLQMVVTNAAHSLGNKAATGAHFAALDRKSTYELSPTGNNVVVEEEMMRVAENQAEYQKVLSIYRKTVDLFKVAIGRPGGV